MSNAKIDENGVRTLLGALSTDGTTIVPVLANPGRHTLKINNATGGTDHGPKNAPRDQNNQPVLMAVSSVDGVTPVVVYADSSGNLLINSN